MLAKIWKKLLLAICIIAILFNITAKLVNRISLEKAISSAPEGVNIREVLNITEEQKTIDNKASNVSRYKTVDEAEAEKAAEEAEKIESEKREEEQNKEIVVEEKSKEQEVNEKEEKSTGGSIIDKVTESITNVKKYDNILN